MASESDEKDSPNSHPGFDLPMSAIDEAPTESQSRQSTEQLKESLSAAKKELSKCTLDNAWAFTIPSVIIAVPLSVRYKTYSPLVFAAVTASGADYYRGLKQCENFAKNVEQIKRRIAEIEHGSWEG